MCAFRGCVLLKRACCVALVLRERARSRLLARRAASRAVLLVSHLLVLIKNVLDRLSFRSRLPSAVCDCDGQTCELKGPSDQPSCSAMALGIEFFVAIREFLTAPHLHWLISAAEKNAANKKMRCVLRGGLPPQGASASPRQSAFHSHVKKLQLRRPPAPKRRSRSSHQRTAALTRNRLCFFAKLARARVEAPAHANTPTSAL